MNIVVLVKEVPDTYGERALDLSTGLADRAGGERVLDEICERALEAALAHADANPGTEVHALLVGPESGADALRKSLAMGATTATHVVDEALVGADTGLTAETLAAAIRRLGFDLVIAGNVATDGAGGVVPAMVAEHLGVPLVSSLREIEITEATVRGTRGLPDGELAVEADLPAVVTVTEQAPEPRFPSFKGVMAAKKKPIEQHSLAALGVDAEADVPSSIMLSVAERPPRTAGVVVVDEGDAAEQLVEYLTANRLV